MSTRARELAKVLSAEQMKQLAELLALEADKPRVDKRQISRLEREFKTAYAKTRVLEEKIQAIHEAYGRSAEQIQAEIAKLRDDAEKHKTTLAERPRRGRPPKVAV
jgi:phage host-nuclease inhibitor protein Gam